MAVCRTEAREELRRQVGTLRFDLNTLASTKSKEAKKDALAARKEFIRAVSGPLSRDVVWALLCEGQLLTIAAGCSAAQRLQHGHNRVQQRMLVSAAKFAGSLFFC